MTGFLIILHADGSPVDGEVLRLCGDHLAARGCKEIKQQTDGEIGHAVGWPIGSAEEGILRGDVTVLADARIDARKDLAAEFGISGELDDSALLAAVYRKSGSSLFEKLKGDFSFGLYHQANRTLVAGRDHFGVKPLFYAEIPSGLIVSNTLEAILAHPDVSDELCDSAIADFLLFDHIQDPSLTSYRDVRRVPPAHYLHFEHGEVKIRRYWEVPIVDRPVKRKSAEIIEQYLHLLRTAIVDRLRERKRVAVMMSGGLDSTTVAALAKELGIEVAAFTLLSSTNQVDPEEKFSRIAAEGVGIPIFQHHQETYEPFDGWQALPHRKPEPSLDMFPRSIDDLYRKVVEYSPLALSGYGGDPGLFPSAEYVRRSLRSKGLPGLAASAAWYMVRHGKLPNVGLRTALRQGAQPDAGPLPEWLNPDLVMQLDLADRWARAHRKPALKHTLRPEAHEILSSPGWEQLFWLQNPGFTGVPIEICHPMFDLRLLNFLLTLPPIPWCVDKELLRRATKGKLPDEIRFRPKTTAGTAMPVKDGIDLAHIPQDSASDELSRYVTKLPKGYLKANDYLSWSQLRPVMLNLWLKRARFCKDGS